MDMLEVYRGIYIRKDAKYTVVLQDEQLDGIISDIVDDELVIKDGIRSDHRRQRKVTGPMYRTYRFSHREEFAERKVPIRDISELVGAD